MQLSTRILYRLRYAASSFADVAIAAMAVGGALLVPYGLWHGGWLRWAALGVMGLCAAVFVAAVVMGGRTRDN